MHFLYFITCTCKHYTVMIYTVMIISYQTYMRSSLIRVYTVCHSVCTIWTHYSMVESHSSNFRVITTNVLGVRIFRKFTVLYILYCNTCITIGNYIGSEPAIRSHKGLDIKYTDWGWGVDYLVAKDRRPLHADAQADLSLCWVHIILLVLLCCGSFFFCSIAGFQPVRCGSDVALHGPSAREIAEQQNATFDHITVPQGSWQADYSKRQARYNRNLIINTVIFAALWAWVSEDSYCCRKV